MIDYDHARQLRTKIRTQRNGWAWHSVSCICQDCLDADWTYARAFACFLPPHCELFEVTLKTDGFHIEFAEHD